MRQPPLALAALLSLGLAAAAVPLGVRMWARADAYHLPQSIDALPIFLSGAVVRAHGDPTSRAALEQANRDQRLQLQPAAFSTLYPATMGVLLGPLVDRPWVEFVPIWRRLLFGGALLSGLAAGAASARGRAAPIAAAAGVLLALVFPSTAECVGIGQVNLLIGALLGLCLLAASRGWHPVAAVIAVVGAGIKLVPAIALWPLITARRWSALFVVVLATGSLLAWTAAHVPLPTILSGVIATIRSKASITPDWLGRTPSAPLVAVLGELRHYPLGAVTLVLGGGCAALSRRDPRALAAAMALGVAWIGADAAGFLVLYATLYLPALVWLATWPLDRGAPGWAWLLAPIGLAPLAFAGAEFAAPEARAALAGELVWFGVALRLVWQAGPRRRPVRLLAAVSVVFLLAAAAWLARPLPPLPGGPPVRFVPMAE